MNTPIISVTGTKGKTTTVAVVADVLQKIGRNTLKVDTTGHFVNGERRSTLEQSKEIWGLVPSVCPGRYLWEFHANPSLQENGVAILECSLGSSAIPGLGYRYHKTGLFLNVFEDHIGSSERVQSQADIARVKDFIFGRIDRDGYAVFNADDPWVVGRLSVIPDNRNITLIPCGLTFDQFDAETHIKGGGVAVTREGDYVVLRSSEGTKRLFSLTAISWTFEGKFIPSIWNLMFAAAAVLSEYNLKWTKDMTSAFEGVRLDPYGGRLTLLRAENGATIIADYAHEKKSLVDIANLARTKCDDGGKVIGVLRLAHDRTDELMRETGHAVAGAYDEIMVYEKIDGHWRQPKMVNDLRFPQVVGRTSEIFYGAIVEKNPNSQRILREDEAIMAVAKTVRPEDVVVVIVNDDIERSIGFIKKAFKAEFV
jgi:cyanophycin synthetase